MNQRRVQLEQRVLAEVPPDLRPWVSTRALRAWVDARLERVHSAELARGFREGCPVRGATDADYRHRWIPVGRAEVLAGIRFKGGDTTAPFVERIGQSGPVDPETVRSALREAFALFRPQRVRERCFGLCEARDDELDQVLYAAPIDDMRALGTPDTGHVVLRLASDLRWLGAFERAFASWREHAGSLGDEVFPADEACLKRGLDDGAVVCAWEGDTWLGVISAERRGERWLDGFCVTEELVAPQAQGRGLGVALQRALVHALPARPGDTLWGTIHGSNVPSRRTAERAGRRPVETWWFSRIATPGAVRDSE